MNVLQVTQVLDIHTLNEVVRLKVPVTFWEQLHRMFAYVIPPADDEPLACWLDWYNEEGDTLLDDPIKIPAEQARWFLRDFCSRPKVEWQRVKLSGESETSHQR